MKRVICTFASHYMTKGFPRFVEQVESMEVFDEIHTLSHKDLDKEIVKRWGKYYHPYSRGYGYWSWKPYLIKRELAKLEDGDMLVYSDLGCFFNPKGRDRLLEYFQMAENHPTGILGLQSRDDDSSGLPETVYYEYEWTKGDIFDYFGVRNNKDFTHTTQVEATVIFIKKCEASVKFIDEWYQILLNDFSLITDAPSRSPNLSGFRENRHDQSLYSMMAKKHDIARISTSELFQQKDWSLIAHTPIHARRDKAYPTKLHYRFRFKLRKWYQFWWKVKYLFN